MDKKIFLLVFTLLIGSLALGQDSAVTTEKDQIIYDLDSDQEPITFSENNLESYRNDEAFNYVEDVEKDNWWTRFKNWFTQLLLEFLEWIFGVGKAGGILETFLLLLPYISALVVLFFVGWLLMKVNPQEILSDKQKSPEVFLTEDEDIIQNQDIDALIQKALENKNYRLAIRYSYLKILKKLSEEEYIQWESQKTNYDYYTELSQRSFKAQFLKVTRLYDFIWYGNFEIDQELYKEAEISFQKITHSL